MKYMLGPWMTLIEDKRLADKFTCLGARFDMISENALSLSTSNTVPESTRVEMKEDGNPDADDEFFINMGR